MIINSGSKTLCQSNQVSFNRTLSPSLTLSCITPVARSATVKVSAPATPSAKQPHPKGEGEAASLAGVRQLR